MLAIAQALGFGFTKTELEHGIYRPEAFEAQDQTQYALQQGMLRVLYGDAPLKMNVVGFPYDPDSVKAQLDLWQKVAAALDGKGALHITDYRAPPGMRVPD